MQPPAIGLSNLLDHLKQPRPARNAIGFQRWCYSKTDSLVCSALICHHQIGVQRVKPPLPALNGSIEALEVNCDIEPLLHALVPPLDLFGLS